jgi:hypothetical protein
LNLSTLTTSLKLLKFSFNNAPFQRLPHGRERKLFAALLHCQISSAFPNRTSPYPTKMQRNPLLQNLDLNTLLTPAHLKEAPQEVVRRIRALKKLQLETVKVQTEYNQRVHELGTEFRKRFDEINKEREVFVTGKREPTDTEADAKLFSWMDDEAVAAFDKTVTSSGDGAPKGIPDFWLNTLKNVSAVADMIAGHDEPILRYLTDITVDEVNEPPSFTLKFHFAENPYFANAVLTKYYKLSIGPNGLEDDILYTGPSIVETQGCEIQWREGKDITKEIPVGDTELFSFFSLFSPGLKSAHGEMSDAEIDDMDAEFELGHSILTKVVDRAVLYYTGEVVDSDYEDSEGSEGSEDSEYESDDNAME